MPTPAEIEARFARFEGLSTPSPPRRKGSKLPPSAADSARIVDELEENRRKQAEREAQKAAEREAEREARWKPATAPIPKELQAGDRARTATLQQSTLHNTTSAQSNSRRPPPQVFAAPLSPPPTAALPQFPFPISGPSPAAKATQNEDFLWKKTGKGDGKSVPPLESPRRAPQPPVKRPPRTLPGEDFRASPVASPLRRQRSDSQRSQRSIISSPAPSMPLPRLPSQQQQKQIEPLDPHLITGQRFTSTTIPKSPPTSPPLLFSGAALQADGSKSPVPFPVPAPRAQVMAIRGRQSSSETSSTPYSMVRSATAPPAYNRKASSASRSTTSTSSSRRAGRSRFGKKGDRRSLDASRSLKTSASIRSALSVIDDLGRLKNATTKPSISGSSTSRSPGIFKRSRKGETMSMLVDTGFFPVEELIYGKDADGKEAGTISKLRQSQMYRVNLPPRLSFLGQPNVLGGLRSPNGSPDSPTDSMASPMSPGFVRKSRGARNRRSGMVRSPLTQIEENKVANMLMEEDEDEDDDRPSPTSTLTAIAEGPDDEENIPPEIGEAMPAAREIRLRGGSVVTVTPPEMTAWRCSVYIQGAIKLPKPAIMPRKNSVASLDPFQEAADDMYQHSLAVPRRRSDDAVVDDICDFFDEFGFDVNIVYDGDRLGVPDISMDEAPELEGEIERFSTPPLEPSPLEIGIAKEVLGSYPVEQSRRRLPPVETEETLRARGKARLSRGSMASTLSSDGSREESFTLGRKAERSGSVILLLPQPEGSMLDTVQGLSPSSRRVSQIRSNARDSSNSGRPGAATTDSSGSGDIQEISMSSSWVASEAVSKVPMEKTTRKTRNPLSRFRKAVATASSVL